jgi:hypothetical protein
MSPLPRRRAKSPAEDVERLLAKVEVGRRAEGGGTLLTEPVIVARGTSHEHLELLDQHGRQLGVADLVRPAGGLWLALLGRSSSPTSYELCDADGRSVLIVREVKLSVSERFRRGWTCEVLQPGEFATITVSRVGRWSSRSYSIAEGPRQIGLLRIEFGTTLVKAGAWLCSVEDETGHDVGTVLLADKRNSSGRVALVLEVKDGSPAQLRRVAVAAILVADLRVIVFNRGG